MSCRFLYVVEYREGRHLRKEEPMTLLELAKFMDRLGVTSEEFEDIANMPHGSSSTSADAAFSVICKHVPEGGDRT